jgi:NodT family efflux transporter outer membrane factor (OMF) lipoprotein
MRRPRLVLALLLTLTACGLNTEPPMALPLPKKFAGALASARPPVDLSSYWTCFGDPVLNRLVDQAVAQNFTLQAAKDRIAAAAATGGAKNATLLPSLDAAGEVEHGKLSPIGQALPGPSPGQFLSFGTLDLSWTLPLFGRLSATEKGAAGVLDIAKAARQTAQVAVVAEIAGAYIDLRADQQQQRLLLAELAESNHIVNLVEIQAGAGIASDLDLARAQAHTDELALKLPGAQLSIDTDISRIAVLEGQTSPDMALMIAKPIPPAPESIPDIVPADLLRLRPQIIEAEAVVVTDAASLGLANADLYPQFTLGGSLSIFTGSSALNPLTGTTLPDKLTFLEGGPGLTIPLLDWGQRYDTAKAAQVNLAAGIDDYHEAVVEGVGAVDTSLAGITASRAESAAAKQEVKSVSRALNTAQILFGHGLTDLTALLDAEKQREQADMDTTNADAAADSAAISLYEAVGGGVLIVPKAGMALATTRTPTVKSDG